MVVVQPLAVFEGEIGAVLVIGVVVDQRHRAGGQRRGDVRSDGRLAGSGAPGDPEDDRALPVHGYRASTTVWIPPRIAKSPVIEIFRGLSAPIRSSRILFVTASWNAPSSRYDQR